MLHVLLFILKILEIILLAVLGIILAGVLLALFVPVRYRADGSFYKISRGEACISWLFRAFRVTASWEEKLVVTVKVLWLQPFQETLWEREPETEDTGNEDPWAGMDDCFPPYGPEGEMSGAGGSQEDPVIGGRTGGSRHTCGPGAGNGPYGRASGSRGGESQSSAAADRDGGSRKTPVPPGSVKKHGGAYERAVPLCKDEIPEA